MPSPVAELLGDLARVLDPLGVRWFLFGAQAAIFHGASRMTADVDVTIELGERPTSSLVDALDRGGFRLRVSDVDGFVEQTRVLPLVHAGSSILCDAVLSGPGIEELFLERAQRQDLDGVKVPVVVADDLIAMKILAGRSKDRDDVQAILAAQGRSLDLDRARATLHLLEQLLDRRDLVAALDQIRKQVGGEQNQ